MKKGQEIRLAENLKQLIKDKNESITSTAKKAKMNKSTLHNYYHGVIPRNLIAIKDLADFFDISINELVFGQNKETKQSQSTLGTIEGKYEITIRRIGETKNIELE